jgi:hypothetical protein
LKVLEIKRGRNLAASLDWKECLQRWSEKAREF